MGLRPTNGDEDVSGADPLDPLLERRRFSPSRRGRRLRTRGSAPLGVFKGA
jgi:hypothetical protein